ncbi:MAG: M56 family metallopeptidase [Clostridia bacterium]|nr:M56 family metallopeptidase [Clostridia bacterium]
MNLDLVFHFVLASTLNGSIVGFIVFLIRKLTGKILPHKFKVLLWAIFIIKLFFPFGPESKVSVFNLPHFQGEYNIPEVFLGNTGSVPVAQVKTIDIIPYIWFLGFVIAGLWLILSNITLSFKLKALSSPADERITKIFIQCKNKLNIKREIRLINQPLIKGVSLYGLLRPKILITNKLTSFTDREIEYIFYHELSHYTRKDVFANYLTSLIQTIHWFNPLIHIFAKVIRQDIELATDEKTLSLIKNGEFKAYGLTLVSMLEEYSRAYSPKLLGVADGKRHIKKRIMQISHYRKKGKYSVCLFSVLAIALSFVTLTTAVPVKSTSIPQVNIKFIKKAEQKEAPLVTQKAEEIEKEVPSSVPKKEQAPTVSEKETADSNVPIPAESILFPEAKVNALPPGTDFDIMLNKALNSGRSREASQNINLNSSCSVREFNIKENDTISLGNYTPDYNGNISLYINSSSSQRLNIILLKDGKALLNASVKPSKTNSYSFTGLDKNDGYELLLIYKPDSEYNNTDISGTVLIY